MTIDFYLWGTFEAQVGTADKVPLGDVLAAKILAYLAFQDRFCTREEIIKAVWGPEGLEGKDRVDEEAFQKQLQFVKTLFKTKLNLSWEAYFLPQRNGARLKEGSFTTDVIRLNDLLAVGLNQQLPEASRLLALHKAAVLRRDYLVDGMECHWITDHEIGARGEYTAKFRNIQQQITQLESSLASGGPAQEVVPYYNGLYDLLPELRRAVAGAKREIIFYGLNFHVTIPVISDLLANCLRAGVTVRFLLLDPHGNTIPDMAPATRSDEHTLRGDGIVSLRRLMALRNEVRDEGAAGDNGGSNFEPPLEVSVFDNLLFGRMYAIDPDRDNGQLFYFPYQYGCNPSRLPGYVWDHKPTGPFTTYANELRRLCGGRSTMRTISAVSASGELS